MPDPGVGTPTTSVTVTPVQQYSGYGATKLRNWYSIQNPSKIEPQFQCEPDVSLWEYRERGWPGGGGLQNFRVGVT